MMEVPESLRKAVEEFKGKLAKEKNVIIYHDTDPDGIAAGALLEKFLEEKGANVKAFGRNRAEVSFEKGKPTC